MISLSHRGYWLNTAEKNSLSAFKRSFAQGYGTETDIRDFQGELVISHDIPAMETLSFENFLQLFTRYDPELPLALNIKSDGLAKHINEYIKFFKIENYFCFDMSIPDTFQYLDAGLNVFVRKSEYEVENDLYLHAKGIWLDSFYQDYLDSMSIIRFIELGKKICIVSPELHRRDESILWNRIKSLPENYYRSKQLMLCTDKIEKAAEFFYE